jgi:predicted HicB family RNase H-like nuclease
MRDDDHRPAVQISTRLPPELVRAVEERARAERRSLSNYVANIIAVAVSQDQGAAA